MKKKILTLFLALTLLCGLLPVGAAAGQETDGITVYVSVSRDGQFVKDKSDTVCAELPVNLSGKTAYSIDDVLTAFHDHHYQGGAAAGYGCYDDPTYGLCLTKLWGVENGGNFGYQLNAASVSVMGLSDAVNDGDYLDVCIYQNAYPDTENYAAFGAYTTKTLCGEALTLTLNEAGYDEFWNLVMSPCAGAAITVDGTATEIVTDADGKATVTLDAVGTHIISAVKTKTVAEQSVTAITAPVCVVTAENAYLSALELRPTAKTKANILPAFNAACRTYACISEQSVSTFWLTAALSAGAPVGSVITADYQKADGSTGSGVMTSGIAKSLALGGKMGNRITAMTLTVGVEGNTQEYNITINPKKTGFLSALTLAETAEGENLLTGFDSDDYSYSVSVAPGTDRLYFTAAPHAENAPDASAEVGETVLRQTGVNPMMNNAGKYSAETDETTELTADGSTVTCLNLSEPVTTKAAFVTVIATNGTKTNKYVIRVNPAPAHDTPEEAFDGSGTAEDPFLIASGDQLTEFALMVNGGNSFAGQTVKLTADVTLTTDWTPIGCIRNCTMTVKEGLNAFSGTFDGGDHTVTVPKGGLPLFGYVENTTIRNLKIYGEEIAGYGLVNNFEGVNLTSVLTIDRVTLLSGTKTLKSGLVGGNITTNGWAANSPSSEAHISNCTVEKGVVIGYDGKESNIGSIAGRMLGTIENCVSDATVQGVDYVGGIVGTKDNSMAAVTVTGCAFGGSVTGTNYVGGIAGGGYNAANDAPNGGKISLIGNIVTGNVTGTDCVGGITGGDPYVAQLWENVVCTVSGNRFNGLIVGESNVGAIVGSYLSLNRYDLISDNTFAANRGAAKGVGCVSYVDTNAAAIAAQFDENTKNATIGGVLYFSTETDKTGCPVGGTWKLEHNRTDDPMGADAESLWKVSDQLIPVCIGLKMTGTPKTIYYVGERLDLSGLSFTAKWNAGKGDTTVSAEELTVTGFDSSSAKTETVTLTYGGMNLELDIRIINYAAPEADIRVSFTLLGDEVHTEDGTVHTLREGNLTQWLAKESYTLPSGATVNDLLKAVEERHDTVCFNGRNDQYGVYIESVSYDGETLGELDNGPLSGWMYTVNGSHPDVGVDARILQSGDAVVFHYTDDYTKEQGGENWGGESASDLISAPEELPFTDIADHWAAESIAFVYSNKLMNGVSDDRFDPDSTLSRAMLVTVLYRLAGEPAVTSGENPFTDVAAGEWYTNAILWAAENKLVSGYGNGRFAPNDPVTREQIAVFLLAYAKYAGYDTSKSDDLAGYTDRGSISSWALEAMGWAKAAGLVNGRSDTMLVPEGTATRAEAAAILTRLVKIFVK